MVSATPGWVLRPKEQECFAMRLSKIAGIALLAGVAVYLAFGHSVTAAPENDEGQVLRHVVLFKFKEGTTPEQIKTVHGAFLDLKNGMDFIVSIEGGKDESPENLQQGFTHAFIVTFKNAADRDKYLPHPVHKEFVKLDRKSTRL